MKSGRVAGIDALPGLSIYRGVIVQRLHLRDFTFVNTSPGRAIFAALAFHIGWLEAKIGYLPGNWDALWSLSNEESRF